MDNIDKKDISPSYPSEATKKWLASHPNEVPIRMTLENGPMTGNRPASECRAPTIGWVLVDLGGLKMKLVRIR